MEFEQSTKIWLSSLKMKNRFPISGWWMKKNLISTTKRESKEKIHFQIKNKLNKWMNVNKNRNITCVWYRIFSSFYFGFWYFFSSGKKKSIYFSSITYKHHSLLINLFCKLQSKWTKVNVFFFWILHRKMLVKQ